jgi:hypothetical protein
MRFRHAAYHLTNSPGFLTQLLPCCVSLTFLHLQLLLQQTAQRSLLSPSA